MDRQSSFITLLNAINRKNMNYENIIERIDAELERLEENGEIVITTTIPKSVSKAIYHAAIAECFDDADRNEALIECSIPHLLEQTSINLSSIFSLDLDDSKGIVDAFYKRLLLRLSMREIAEMIWHETPFEIALLSYYCVKLKNLDTRDFEYIDWRKKYYAK